MQFYLCWICINNCTKTDSGYEGFCSSWGLCLDFRSGERLQLWSCTSPASSGASCCSPALLRAVLLCSEGSGLLLSQQDSEPRPACRNLPGRRVVVSASCASILCFVELFPTLTEAAVMQQPPFLPHSRQQLTVLSAGFLHCLPARYYWGEMKCTCLPAAAVCLGTRL